MFIMNEYIKTKKKRKRFERGPPPPGRMYCNMYEVVFITTTTNEIKKSKQALKKAGGEWGQVTSQWNVTI